MIETLDEVMKTLAPLLDDPTLWDSLVINLRKPHTYRAFCKIGANRICLHRFEPCSQEEAFFHPHPWPGAFILMQGSYRMKVGYSVNRQEKPDVAIDLILTKGSKYSMTNPLAWHSVQPLETCYSVMVNGEPWAKEIAHERAPTTKGKDLEKMSNEELVKHLDKYKFWLNTK